MRPLEALPVPKARPVKQVPGWWPIDRTSVVPAAGYVAAVAATPGAVPAGPAHAGQSGTDRQRADLWAAVRWGAVRQWERVSEQAGCAQTARRSGKGRRQRVAVRSSRCPRWPSPGCAPRSADLVRSSSTQFSPPDDIRPLQYRHRTMGSGHGHFTTRSSSSSEVMPATAFAQPSCSNVSMPLACAARRISAEEAWLTVSRSIDSSTVMIS